ncbi:MAG TPA: hypothetical protein VH475_00530 [Tepidisphaeraceae bacterium]
MDRTYLRFLAVGNADRIVEALSDQQHVQPHQSVGEAVALAGERLGVCPQAARAAIESLRVDPSQSIGRLRRTELIQLAHTIHRFWRQSVVDNSNQSQPV